jgi:hypothetical protein
MGGSVSAAGDVDADGFDDFLLGVPFHDAASFDEGQVQLRSGRDGSLLRSWVGARKAIRFGYSVAGVGDTNGDGVPDVLVGAPSDSPNGWVSGAAFLYSGKDGSELRAFRDCAIFENWGQQSWLWATSTKMAARTSRSAARVRADPRRATRDGSVSTAARPGRSCLRRRAVSTVRDSVPPSLLRGTWTAMASTTCCWGSRVWAPARCRCCRFPPESSSTSSKKPILATFWGRPLRALGMSTWMVGRTSSSVLRQYNSVQPKAGFVELRSGKTGQRIYTIQGSILNGGFGSSIAVLGDLVAIAAPRAGTYPNVSGGIVTLHRVRDGVQVAQLVGEQAGDYFGRALAAAGDLDQDGQLDLMVGAPMSSIPPTGNPRPGAASIYSPGLTSLRADAERVSLSKGGLIRLQGQGPSTMPARLSCCSGVRQAPVPVCASGPWSFLSSGTPTRLLSWLRLGHGESGDGRARQQGSLRGRLQRAAGFARSAQGPAPASRLVGLGSEWTRALRQQPDLGPLGLARHSVTQAP